MGTAVIIDRISAALAAGELKPASNSTMFKPISSMSDLLRPWGEMFPGVDLDNEGEIRGIFGRGIVRHGPNFTPHRRLSRRPLPPPRLISASPLVLNPDLFQSVGAVWDYYNSKEKADSSLLECAFTNEGITLFLEPLCRELSDYHPLEMMLEDMYCARLSDLDGFRLMIPHYTYEEESAATVMAFLSGPESIAGHLTYFFDEQDRYGEDSRLELHPKDLAIIEEVGFVKLVEAYAEFQGEKTCDMAKLSQWYEFFFDPVIRRFPEQMEDDWPIVTDGGMDTDFRILSREDIEFGIAYSQSFFDLINAIPDPDAFEYNTGGATETFIHELCEVWRKTNGKRRVKWISPKSQTLLHRYKIGAI
jgi:hypothetical protein